MKKIRDYLEQKKRIKTIKSQFSNIIIQLNLINKFNQYPKDIQIKFIEYGYQLNFNISGICDYKSIENNLSYISNCLGAVAVESNDYKGDITLKVYTEKLDEKRYIKYLLNPYTLLFGYNHEEFLTADMKKVPHCLISGLAGQGKSRMVNYLIENLVGVETIILNAFEDDYKDFELINGYKEIENFLKTLLDDKTIREKPLYIIIEEMQGLNSSTKITNLCKELLSYGRHYNIYIIGIIQVATKENCKFKDLFNTRVTFKQMDSSAYSVCLGIPVNKDLKHREFYLYAEEGLKKGYTFKHELAENVNFNEAKRNEFII